MTRTAIQAAGQFRTNGPYSPAIRCGEWVFVSGQGPLNYQTGEFENLDLEHQV